MQSEIVFVFVLQYAANHRPMLNSIEYLRCIEVGAMKCLYGHRTNLLHHGWISDKLEHHTLNEEEEVINNFLQIAPLPCGHLPPNPWSQSLEVFAICNRGNLPYDSSINNNTQSSILFLIRIFSQFFVTTLQFSLLFFFLFPCFGFK